MEPEFAVPLAATSSMFITKKLRSKRPRRRRSQIAAFVLQKQAIDLSDDSGSCCNFDVAADVSCDSSSVSNQKKKRKFADIKGGYGAKAKKNLGNEGIGDSQFRRITRSYSKKEREAKGNEAEVSESSCVESNSGADFLVFGERSSKLKKGSENLEKPEKNDAVSVSLGAATTRSAISGVELIPHGISELSSENKENDLVSLTSGFEYSSTSKFDAAIKENVKGVVDANFTVSNSESVVEQKPKSFSGLDSSHLACNEQFSLEEIVLLSDCSSSQKTVFSELQSDFFPETSDLDFSDYTPSLSYDSGSQFSEKSNDSPTSVAYSLFLEFKQQFSRSSFHLDPKLASRAENEHQINSKLVRFENEEDEESYKRLREREKRRVYLHDYAEEYRFTTDYGDLVLLQRSLMTRWIIEHCTAKEFQQETTFLGVCLLDRFLSKGFFRNKRSLQIVGIACLVLATRIEENQPYNSVRQKKFYVGTNTYSRSEVVAMEWLVMEVLDFQCFLPTIYNFLWFYLKAAKANADVEKRAKYLAVLALSDHQQLRYWPSTVAAGVVIMASMDSNQHGSYHRVIEIHMRTKDNDLPECMKSLNWLVQYIR
ncbi:SOLO DANCERS [Hibiscus trionum]|uniref:SOLO DANCERS n=1 Tax=Hibiscus trionum TaxID=183268 RepID=A0A9W7ITL9_HIBTR|nr:SOLO DANCERS [Hibiscus trionum]